eukprot:2129678-Alexandrium_andersonii.AAC.1
MESESMALVISPGSLTVLALCFLNFFLAFLLWKEKKKALQNPGTLDSASEEEEPEEDWIWLVWESEVVHARKCKVYEKAGKRLRRRKCRR